MSARYLTTTLPYVNADPHIGFALELVQTDVLARVWRAAGDEVFFNTGTDEHGQKIYDAARKAGKEPQVYIDYYAAEVQKLKETLNVSTDAFIRTTSPAHVQAAQEMWRRCEANKDIYLKEYEGLYCVGHEAFLTERDLVDGKCPDHNIEPQVLREKNYFFKFKKYEETLLKYLQKPDTIVPEWRRQEAINFVKGGLEDFSISREKKRLSWGIPVPGDESQVMYVWFDALTNYISTLGWPDDAQGNFKKFWEAGVTLQVAGKDQVRFQSLMWQAMLMSAGIKNTDQIFYHGFITSGGQKMSKSLGNVINPLELVEKYGIDATRYFLLRHVHPFEDTDVTWEKLDEWYTANLTNGLGNFVSRVMKMSEDNLDIREIKNFRGDTLEADAKDKQAKIHTLLEQFRFNDALDEIWKFIAFGDELIQKKKPFQLIKENPEKGKEEILNFVWRAFRIANFLEPFMPDTSRKIRTAFQANQKPDNLFPRLL